MQDTEAIFIVIKKKVLSYIVYNNKRAVIVVWGDPNMSVTGLKRLERGNLRHITEKKCDHFFYFFINPINQSKILK